MITDPQATHRRLAGIIVLENESEDRFLELAASLYDEFQPQTTFEESLIGEMIAVFWRRMRIWDMEKAAMDHEMSLLAEDPNPDPATRALLAFRSLADNSRTLELLNRCDARYEREYLRAHRRFLELRDRRTPPATQPPPVQPTDSPAPLLPPENRNCDERTQQVTENIASSSGDTAPPAPLASSQTGDRPRISPFLRNFWPVPFLHRGAAHAR